MQNKNKNTTRYNKKEEEKYELTCLAIPKSASLTIPDESTSKLAPLMSLWTQEKKKSRDHFKCHIYFHAEEMNRNFTYLSVKF